MVEALDLSEPRSLHIVGVGGAGMSAIALVLAGMGHRVSGSDLKDSRVLTRLRAAGVEVALGHAPGNVAGDLDAVVYSTAVPLGNVELQVAREKGIPTRHRSEVLAALSAARRTIAVAGSHGKTTTSSMLTLILRAAGWNPSFVIGGELNEVGTNAAHDSGEWMVMEADESDGTFLALAPEAAVVTNVEPDHLDRYGDLPALVDAFRRFVHGPPVRVLCADDPVAASLAAELHRSGPPVVTYGAGDGADYRLDAYEGMRSGSRFALHGPAGPIGEIALPVPGRHNALNATGAAAVALEIGVPFDAVHAALAGFAGVARRFQYRGTVGGVTLVDDYAHLPGEVAAAIGAAREGRWGRVVVVFQPHRFTRTEALAADFADAFTGADRVVLTDVYPAGETPRPGVSGRLILHSVLDAHPGADVAYLPRRSELVALGLRGTRPGDVVLTLGAGDVTTLADAWMESGGAASPAAPGPGVR